MKAKSEAMRAAFKSHYAILRYNSDLVSLHISSSSGAQLAINRVSQVQIMPREIMSLPKLYWSSRKGSLYLKNVHLSLRIFIYRSILEWIADFVNLHELGELIVRRQHLPSASRKLTSAAAAAAAAEGMEQ